MRSGAVDFVIVGADRIAANGDIMIEHRHADKIGEWRGNPTALAGVGVNNPAFAISSVRRRARPK